MKYSNLPFTALFTFLIGAFFYSSATAQSSKIDSSEMVTIRIDPGAARGARVSEVFEEVNFIPLETTKESLFGSINQLEITENCYIVFDYDTKSVLIFSKEGKFKAKINRSQLKNESEKENQGFWGFSLKQENKQDFIRIASGKYTNYFDLDGKLIKKVSEDDEENLKFTDHTEIRNHYLLKNNKDSLYYQIGLRKDSIDIAQYFPYDPARYENDLFLSGGSGPALYDSDRENEKFYINYYDYNIYKLTSKKMFLAYRVFFPAIHSLPKDFSTNPIYKNKRQEYFKKNPKAIYAISNTYKIGDQLLVKMHDMDPGKEKKDAIIYNLKTAALTSLDDLEPDSSSSFLPVTDLGFHYDFANRGFLKFNKKYFYTSYSSLAMFTFKEQSVDKKPKYSALMSSYFKTENKKSNPVIIQLKLKQN